MTQKELVHYGVEDGIALISVDNPPVNALAPGMREGIIAFLEKANGDAGVSAIVLVGEGKNFIAGADIRQFGQTRSVSTRTSTAAIDSSAKPIVAAIQGYALGGGLEHVLACHYRVATVGAKLGLPEVTLGVIPGGGGTQRLPRLVGPKKALQLILGGRPISAEDAEKIGVVDALVPKGELRRAAIDFAKSIAQTRPLPRVRDRNVDMDDESLAAIVADARKAETKNGQLLPAKDRAIACVEAAVRLPFDEGIAFEEKAFAALENSDEAKALRYAFFAEREARKVPDVDLSSVPPIRSAAIIGAGTMGGGIAMCFADANIHVKVLEASAEALDRGLQRIRDTYAVKVKRGSMAKDEMDRRLKLIQGVQEYDAISDCDVAIEAVFERLDIKQDVFRKLDAALKPGALLLTNSSAIDIDAIADATSRPGDVAGAHFFAPANVMKLCEIVKGPRTRPATIARTMEMGRAIGKVCAVAGSCDGFVANRSRAPMMAEMMLMLEEGATPVQIDRVMEQFGYPKGPFAVNDISGLDVSYEGRKRRAAADPEYRKLHVPDRLVEMGRKGQKTGAGWYRYENGDRTPIADDVVKQVIADVAKDFGIPQREFSDEEILQRVLFASVNEACKILEDGKAYRSSDIDVMWLYGFGFPRHRGGLMFWADTVGAAAIYREVSKWHSMYGKRWRPSKLLQEVAETGIRFRDVVPAGAKSNA
ncbi:3-hydroxyacyl-CoA dehydrogenase NAD-binding domain-containing protein [Cupriavidus pinatubonensis]|uniref:3-hydroxyacyl-CoA dehydrogenase NAD-binding domain-containing protein n=1 Tax=Cupriavidus pinatubonensis TaxID=248026 RepID=UPI00112D1D06|nr:3-hydroxyacyl-CoA dehydrogenase NAD-binding domain-containing protein [Cupriavidus pinatubonensis]TPQ38237.1 fatty-acid oxidation protein subunit alpha [Cupriavidus pinatubonensis]